jgi:hypothetical protein
LGYVWQYGNASLAEVERESGVTYQVRLTNGCRIRVHVFVVYDDAKEVTQSPCQPGGKVQKCYKWPSVSRAQCKKGCQVLNFPSPFSMFENNTSTVIDKQAA